MKTLAQYRDVALCSMAVLLTFGGSSLQAQDKGGARQNLDRVLITFEEFAAPSRQDAGISAPQPVDFPDQYRGLTFRNRLVLDFGGVPRLDSVPRSGRHAAVPCSGPAPCRDSSLVLEFAEPQTMLRVWVGSVYPPDVVITLMRAYDRGGVLVGRDSAVIQRTQWPRIQVPLAVRADSNVISFVSISASGLAGRSFAIDDVEFGRLVTPPPSPPPDTVQMRLVPDVIGRPLAEAARMLDSAGFGVGRRRRVQTDGLVGTVYAQYPVAGKSADTVRRVDLDIIARQAPPQRLVPDVTGRAFAEAESLLATAGLGVGMRGEVRMEGQVGTVHGQYPAGGTPADTVRLVNLEVIVGPPDPPLPWIWIVVGAAAAAAAATPTVRRWWRERFRHVPRLSAALADTGLSRQAVTFTEAQPLGLELRLTLLPESLERVEDSNPPTEER